jgi:hypothetical protein
VDSYVHKRKKSLKTTREYDNEIRELEKEWNPEWIPFLDAVVHSRQIIKAGYGSINGGRTSANDISYIHTHNKINRI